MRSQRGRILALLVVVALVAAGCGGGKKKASTARRPGAGAVESAVPGESLAPGETLAPGATARPGSASRSTGKVTARAPGAGGPGVVLSKIPDFGLKTQGVTDKEVKVGFTYNVAGCGDSGTLSAMFGNAVTGDPDKSVKAFTRYVNDQKMLGDRKFTAVIADDGGGGCEEKAGAAARKIIDEEKVFTVVPGLNVITDYAAARKIPVAGGRDDEASIDKWGAGTFKILDSLDGALYSWAAFGRHYLDSKNHKPCLIHVNNEEWNGYEKLAKAAVAKYDVSFGSRIYTYEDDVSTAQQQSNALAARAKADGCDQAWFMFYNPIALVFLTQGAKNNLWFPTWTWTSFTVLVDDDKIAKLMDQSEWANAIGLSQRVPNGVGHPKEANCKKIYEKYYPNDGQSDGAYVWLYCAQILPLAESMRRAINLTGTLNANSLMVGADAITQDLYFDAHVPIDWKFPAAAGPFKQRGMTHYTVAKWNASTSKYDFPEYPQYWERMGAGKSGGFDLRSTYTK